MRLYLFRHAAVEDAYRGRYNGHIDLSASVEGLDQAKQHFKELQTVQFDAVYCSTLQRAKQTLDVFGLQQEIFFSDLIREKSWGRHEGKSYDEVVAMEGKSYENFRQWIELLDGESYESFIQKIGQFLTELEVLNRENILVVTHAGVIYTLIHLIKHISLEEAFNCNTPYGNYYILDFN